jgi:hypothetical protein
VLGSEHTCKQERKDPAAVQRRRNMIIIVPIISQPTRSTICPAHMVPHMGSTSYSMLPRLKLPSTS